MNGTSGTKRRAPHPDFGPYGLPDIPVSAKYRFPNLSLINLAGYPDVYIAAGVSNGHLTCQIEGEKSTLPCGQITAHKHSDDFDT